MGQPTEPAPRVHLEVLGFSGSLRRGSFNTAALRAAGELLPPGMTLVVFDLADLPFYDGDVEARGFPEPVARVHARIARADALLIATPEYNHSIPGLIKNAVDWASRPPEGAPIQGKPVGIIGASPSQVGTARAQLDLRRVCTFAGALPMPPPEVLIGRADAKFDAEGRLTDEPTRVHLGKFLEALAAWTLRLRSGRAPDSSGPGLD